jgi:serine/threonine protein kinase
LTLSLIVNEYKQKNRRIIGLPHYIASGSHTKMSTKYRFLILPRYSRDIQQILDLYENKFNIKTVLTIALQLLDTLEYIHCCGFIHADIKASNILINEKAVPPTTPTVSYSANKQLNQNYQNPRRLRTCRLKKPCRDLRSNKLQFDENQNNCLVSAETLIKPNQAMDYNQVYLLDYGLACKFLQSNGQHKPYFVDLRKAHALGTILFCSLDAHNGAQSRRSDLESLGYNMVYWLTSVLPWMSNDDDYEVVKSKKQICMQELDHFLHFCFGRNIPIFLKNFFNHVKSLKFTDTPDYEYCRKVLTQGFNEYGYKKVYSLDFINKEGWGFKKKRVKNTENERRRASVVCSIIRTPLKSNLPGKHVLRQKDKAKAIVRWSKILFDPELILKSAKKVKELEDNETSDVLADLNIQNLNPTEAMMKVYNNYLGPQNNAELGVTVKQKSNE